MSQSEKTELSPAARRVLRIAGTAAGILLILLALGRFAMYFFGSTATAVLTDESKAWSKGVCTHNIRYEFELDGEVYSGSSRVPNSSSDLEGISDRVYYLPFAPSVNALEYDAQPTFAQVLFIAAGCIIIVLVNKKSKKKSLES